MLFLRDLHKNHAWDDGIDDIRPITRKSTRRAGARLAGGCFNSYSGKLTVGALISTKQNVCII